MPNIVVATYAGTMVTIDFANPLAVLPIHGSNQQTGCWMRWGVVVIKQVPCL